LTTGYPQRGEVWLASLDPTLGHEQAGTRPGIIVSVDAFNRGGRLIVYIPMTTRQRDLPLHVRIEPPEGGVRSTSYVLVENIRAISPKRLVEKWGEVAPHTMHQIEDRLKTVLGLY